MTGAPEQKEDAYVSARRVLLDAVEALQDHRDAVVLVGAQAIYLHTGEGTLAVAPYTSDADLVLNPGMLAADPKINNSTLDNKLAQDVKGSSGFVKSVSSSACAEPRISGDAYPIPAGALRQPGPASG